MHTNQRRQSSHVETFWPDMKQIFNQLTSGSIWPDENSAKPGTAFQTRRSIQFFGHKRQTQPGPADRVQLQQNTATSKSLRRY